MAKKAVKKKEKKAVDTINMIGQENKVLPEKAVLQGNEPVKAHEPTKNLQVEALQGGIKDVNQRIDRLVEAIDKCKRVKGI